MELYQNYFPRLGQHYYITPSVVKLITNPCVVATNDMKVYCSVTCHCCIHNVVCQPILAAAADYYYYYYYYC